MSKAAYCFLKPGEIIKAGDEFKNLFTGDWLPSLAAGCVVGARNTYRRKVAAPVEVGEGYRALEVGEVVQHGDDYWYGNRQWLAIGVVCADVRVRPGQQYRRKKAASPSPGEGYRFLKPGEIVEAGDEYFRGDEFIHSPGGAWQKALAIGVVGRRVLFRRKITAPTEPGTGYRFLVPGGAR